MPSNDPEYSSTGFESDRTRSATSEAEVSANLAQAWAAAQLYMQTQIARAKLAIISLVMLIIVGIFAVFIGVTLLVTATVLLLNGISHGLAALLHTPPWAGELIVGLAFVAGVLVAGYVAYRQLIKLGKKQFKSAPKRRTSTEAAQRRTQN